MKKILTLTITLLLISTFLKAQVTNKRIDSTIKQINKAGPIIYKDSKAVINYATNKIEQASDTIYKLLNKGYGQLSKGAVHSFEILKTQQLVKSLHHLFYWILSIILAFVITYRLRKHSIDNKANEWQITTLVLLFTADAVLFIFNIINFMEMWTGFINPEYGVYMEILEYINK